MKYQLESDSGKILLTNLQDACAACVRECVPNDAPTIVTCKVEQKLKRRGSKSNKHGLVYLCSSDQDDMKSSKTFNKKFQLQFILLGQIESIKNAIIEELIAPTKRLTHNITSLNAHCLQEFYSIVPQDDLSLSFRDQLALVEKKLQSSIKEASKAFLRVLKNNRLMKTELSVFQKLHDADSNLRKRKHEIRRVLLSAFHVYFQDFTDKSIVINVVDNQSLGFFDYESIVVALMHIADNATKYAAVNSEIDINFAGTENEVILIIKMLSIKIEDIDLENIFKEGYSGINSKKLGVSGNGIGMNIVQKLLKLNNAKIEFFRNCNPAKSKIILGIPYEINEIRITFQKFKANKES